MVRLAGAYERYGCCLAVRARVQGLDSFSRRGGAARNAVAAARARGSRTPQHSASNEAQAGPPLCSKRRARTHASPKVAWRALIPIPPPTSVRGWQCRVPQTSIVRPQEFDHSLSVNLRFVQRGGAHTPLPVGSIVWRCELVGAMGSLPASNAVFISYVSSCPYRTRAVVAPLSSSRLSSSSAISSEEFWFHTQ